MMRRVITNNVTTAVVLILFAMGVWPVASQEAARLRCQKSGCREGGAALADEEPALIIQSPSDRVIPLVPWMIAFFVLRLAAQVIRQLIPIIRRTLPEVQDAVGHYYDSIVSIDFSRMIPKRSEIKRSTAKKRVKSSGRSVSSNRSLGSLADLIDDTSEAQSSRGASLWYDNDSSSAGYSSAYTSFTSDNDDKSSAMESQSEFGLSVLSTSESSTDSTYNYNNSKYDDGDQSRGGESVVSKFLNYISEATPNEYAQQYHNPPHRRSLREHGRDDRRPSLDNYKLRRSHNAGTTVENYSQSGNRSQSRQRRSTVDETNYPSYRSPQVATTESGNQRRGTTESSSNDRRRESPNAPESLLITQSPPSSGGVKMRKAAAKTKPKRQDHGNSDNYDKTSKSSSSKRQQQQQKQRHDREAVKKSSGLHHHLSKFSPSNKDDNNENYSTMLSTVDLRSRATRDTSMYSESFVAN